MLNPSLKKIPGLSAIILITTSAVKMIVKATLSYERMYRIDSSKTGYLSIAKQIVFRTITSMMVPSNRGCEIKVSSCNGSLFE